MAQRLLNDDPQAAYEHARYAASPAGRVAGAERTTGQIGDAIAAAVAKGAAATSH